MKRKRIENRIMRNTNALIIIVMGLFIIFVIPNVIPWITQADANAEAKYGNCHIVSNLTGDLYICKKSLGWKE